MPNTDGLLFNRPSLRSPSLIRNISQDGSTASSFAQSDSTLVSGSALGNSASFKYDVDGDGIKSTQQLNVDWSQFQNHTFFNNAQVKTNVAFDKIFNQFPFDGTQGELELFLDSLTGFEKYVYDQLPKNTGYLFFSGTAVSETTGGTYVTVKDQAGANFPGASRNLTGQSFLNPSSGKSLCIEFQLFVPSGSNGSQVVLHKMTTGSSGYAVVLPGTSSVSSGTLDFLVFSGSTNFVAAASSFQKGQWNHVACIWDRSVGVNTGFIYINQQLASLGLSGTSGLPLGDLDPTAQDLYIGSGSSIIAPAIQLSFIPSGTLSGALDELRVWHKIPSGNDRLQNVQKAIFAQEDLKLYYKFNEPSGSQSNLVLDSSGNSLHGILSPAGISLHVREAATGSVAGPSPVVFEKLANSPILFPLYPGTQTLQATLLSSASLYDAVNPNLITKLIPKHYLLDGATQDGLATDEGLIVSGTISGNNPQTTTLGSTQALLLLLYTWAKFFDEMKLYIQAFADLYRIDYDQTDTVGDRFLQFYADRFGLKLPALFTGASIPQFVDAENIDNTISTNQFSLQYVQNQIWRKILLNLKDVIRSKGTIHAVKSFIRSVGIDPDNNFRIREFGGPTKNSLLNAGRERHTRISSMLDFSSGGFLYSPMLSASRNELGFPGTQGTIPAGGVSPVSKDGILTSGSWTFEANYRFPSGSTYASSQSLVRIEISSAFAGLPTPGYIAPVNLVLHGNNLLTLYMSPNAGVSGVLSMSLTGSNLFDGDVWNICFGRFRADQVSSSLSSSYFLRLGKNVYGELSEYRTTSSWFNEQTGSINTLVWSNLMPGTGLSIAVGSQSLGNFGFFLNDPTVIGDDARATAFQGRIGHVRFWSKGLQEDEFREHVRNPESLGVDSPSVNFNFNTYPTGAFERLRADVSMDQPITASDVNGNIQLVDFSQNTYQFVILSGTNTPVTYFSGTGFPATASVIVPQRYDYSLLSPKFDVQSTTDKVRIRSFQDFTNVQSSSYAQVAPIYEIPRNELPQDNTRFTVDFSIVDALDQDIINIFATLDALDNVIGNPELIFSGDYPGLESLRFVYFNRLTSKINLKNFFDFYKWFDTNIGSFITQLIPRKTKFLGVNFVIESHMLERPKMEYLYSDIYLGDSMRDSSKETVLLEQFETTVKRY